MKTESPLSVYLRIFTVSIFIALLGLSPAPHAIGKYLSDASHSMADGDPLTAATSLADIASYYPWRYEMIISAAQYASQAGDPTAVINYLERDDIRPHLTTDDLLLLGDAYAQTGNSSMAAATWQHILDLADSIPACQRLADLYMKQLDYASAATYLKKLFALNPSDVHLYYQVGLLTAIADPDKALPFLVQAAQLDTAVSAQARALHDKIRTADLFDDPAYTALIVGRQLADFGEWQLAFAAFQRATTLKPTYADAWAFLGEAKQQVALQESGSIGEIGLSELKRSLQLDSRSVLGNMLMALYWERKEDYSQAQRYVEQARLTSPDDPYLYTELGNILSKAGDLPAAQVAFKAAINLAPQEPLFYRLLAQFALDNNIQIHELALPAARQAVLLNPQDANSLDVMAQVMLELVDYRSAERYSIKAVQSDPKFAPAYLHLGTAYLYQGNSDLARLWLSRAESVDPSSWVAAQAARFLDYYFPK